MPALPFRSAAPIVCLQYEWRSMLDITDRYRSVRGRPQCSETHRASGHRQMHHAQYAPTSTRMSMQSRPERSRSRPWACITEPRATDFCVTRRLNRAGCGRALSPLDEPSYGITAVFTASTSPAAAASIQEGRSTRGMRASTSEASTGDGDESSSVALPNDAGVWWKEPRIVSSS